ncbi:hypothetical protein DFH29DRAFT_880557 [Suillus ampliporus]|nr:hypothetical protein DFH29DRAFT_880557 [Suillus ampliporus]
MPATTHLTSPETCGSYEHQLQSSSTVQYKAPYQRPRLRAKQNSTFETSPSPANTHPSLTGTSLDSPLKNNVQTKICPTSIPLQRAGSLKPADDELSARDAIDLCKRIIATIRDHDNAQEVKEFFDAIDDDKLPRKLVYAAELKLLTATLPNQLHQAYLGLWAP